MFDLGAAETGQILCPQVGILLAARRKLKVLRIINCFSTKSLMRYNTSGNEGESEGCPISMQ